MGHLQPKCQAQLKEPRENLIPILNDVLNAFNN